MRGVLVKFRYCVQDRQAGARSTFRIIVVRLGIAEVRHYSVTKVLRDMPAETLDCLRRGMMIPGDDLPPLLRVEMASYLGRADEITEKHRQMPPLALKIGVRLDPRRSRAGSIERCRA